MIAEAWSTACSPAPALARDYARRWRLAWIDYRLSGDAVIEKAPHSAGRRPHFWASLVLARRRR
jgi:hypothetical protein